MFQNLYKEKIIKNSVYLVISEIISKLLFIVLIIFISRTLGVEGLGAYGFIFAFTGLFFVFSDTGQPVFIRDLITRRECIRKFWGNLLFLKFFNSLIVYMIMVIVTLTSFIPPELKLPVQLAGLILFGDVLFKTAKSIFIAYQKIKPVAFVSIVGSLLTVSLSIFYILSGKGISWIVIAFAIGELFKAIVLNFLLVKKFSKPDLKIDLKLCTKWAKNGFYFIMQRQFREGLFQVDILIIFLMSNLYATGMYQASYKIALNTGIIPLLFGTVFYPYYIDRIQSSFRELKFHYTRHKKNIALTITILCLFLLIFSKQIIVLLYGSEFMESVLILRILLISTLFFSLSSNNIALLNAIKKECTVFYLLFFIFLLNIILDIVLIKPYGIIGIASSTVICSVLCFVITEVYTKGVLKVDADSKEILT